MRVGRITRLASSSWFSPIDWPRLSYCVWVANCPVGQQDDKAIVSSPCGFSHFICMKFSLPCFHSCHTGSVSQTPNMVARMTKLHRPWCGWKYWVSDLNIKKQLCSLGVFFQSQFFNALFPSLLPDQFHQANTEFRMTKVQFLSVSPWASWKLSLWSEYDSWPTGLGGPLILTPDPGVTGRWIRCNMQCVTGHCVTLCCAIFYRALDTMQYAMCYKALCNILQGVVYNAISMACCVMLYNNSCTTINIQNIYMNLKW